MKKLLVLVSLVLMLGLVLTGCQNDTPVPTPATDKVNAVAPTFTNQLANTTYTINATATALNGTAMVTDGGTVSYQWYKSSSNTTEKGMKIDGAINATYTPLTGTAGTSYYYVIVTNTIADNKNGGNKTATATSNVATIIVNNKVNAVAPAFTNQLVNATYTTNATATALNGTATVSDGEIISYQWYKNTSNSTENGTKIDGAINATYTPLTGTAGTNYYYVVATNKITDNGDGGTKTATTTSNVATITVKNKVNAVAPTFTNQLVNTTHTTNATATALNGTVTVTDEGTISYQWYKNTSNSTENGTKIDGAINATYTPLTGTVGTNYYYVVATNKIADNGDGGIKTATTTSNVATITVIYALGNIGPGGGVIFYVDSTGAYREVSPVLEYSVDWTGAKTKAEGYTNNGYDDWYLPTSAELNQLKKSGSITETATLWSSEEWGYWPYVNKKPVPPINPTEAWIYNFTNEKRTHVAKATATYSARAVRSYSPKKYTNADIGKTGPGGGKIFWVDEETGAYKEVSEKLAPSKDWDNAQITAEAYTGGVFNDWYLPNATELSYVYIKKNDLKITDTKGHWSSSEFDFSPNNHAWLQFFGNGGQYNASKTSDYEVRAIRSFIPVGN